MQVFGHVHPSSVGDLVIAVDDRGRLLRLGFGGRPGVPAVPGEAEDDPDRCAHVAGQLDQYFAGQLRDFDLELGPQGTAFQLRVWDELCRIPYGTTTTYGEIARRLGGRTSARAVGTANGRNPIAVVIPCHRVIGADGSLTGFGGGLAVKEALLRLEGVHLAGDSQPGLPFLG